MGALRGGLLSVLLLVGHGLVQAGSAWQIEAGPPPGAPSGGIGIAAERPGSDVVADAHRIGDWTLVDGRRLVSGDGAVVVACAAGGNGVVVEVVVAAPAAPAYELRFEAEAMEPWWAVGLPAPGGAIVLADADEDHLLALLARHGGLTLTLTPSAAGADALTFRLTTAGFETAFSWLGCGVSDTCPVRSCGP
jgi:hypothetical protein